MSIVSNAQTNNAKYVSLIPENGTQFNPNQKVVFNLDPSLGWIKGRDSYLVFDVLNTSSDPLRLSLGKAGGSSLINQINIYSKQTGILLESLNNYNQWVHTEAQYTTDDQQNLVDIEGFPKPFESQLAVNSAGGANINNEVGLYNLANSYKETENNTFSPIDNNGNLVRTSMRVCVPLRTGIFRWWDAEKLVPILQLGGLRIELILEQTHNALSLPKSDTRVGGTIYGISPNSVQNVGLSADTIANTATTITFATSNFSADMGIKECGMCVGSKITITGTVNGATNTAVNKTITAMAEVITGEAKALTLTIDSAVDATHAMTVPFITLQNTDNANYKITNCEMRVLQEMPPDTKMANMDYVFTTYDVFNDVIAQTALRHNQDITSVASKAKALFTLYEDPAKTGANSFLDVNNYYTGVSAGNTGIKMNEVVYFINNKLYPLRPYNPNHLKDKVINQNEVVKAFGAINKGVRSLGNTLGASLDIYSNRYLHARELARGYNNVFDLQNAEPQIRVGFSGARGTDYKGTQYTNLNMRTFVFSKKIIKIDGDSGLTVVH
tara:strand:- start:2743 stop:4407 length:1665 start_codon:yes stop_codon:yes gene_type:complete